MSIKNYICECLECCKSLVVLNPQEGDTVTCEKCGAMHKIEIIFSLKNLGLFDVRYKK